MSDAVQDAIAAREAAKRPKPVYGRVATVAPPSRKVRRPKVEDVPAPEPEVYEPEPEPEPEPEGEE